MQTWKRTVSRIRFLLMNDFFAWLLLLILLTSVIMSFDGTFHLFSPSMQFVETNYENDQIAVSRYFDGSVFYNVRVVKTYWIILPFFPITGLNLSIPNPSNFSIYDSTRYLPGDSQLRAIKVEADPTLAYAFKTSLDGNVTSLSVMPLNGSTIKPRASIKLSYNDILDCHFINMSQPIQKDLGNGSTLVQISLIVNNTDSRRLYSDQFALFSVQDYGNMSSFEFFQNGTLNPSQWNYISGQWLWTSLFVASHSFANFTVSAVFEEARP
jgi:hypothetical protein